MEPLVDAMEQPFVSLPAAHLPVAPRPLAGELLSSWLGRLAAANALDFGELLELVRVRLAPPRAGAFYAGGLDYACSGPVLKALCGLSRLSPSRVAALSLRRRFGPLGWFWLSHELDPCHDARHRPMFRPKLLPSYCAECLREQTQGGQPAHLRPKHQPVMGIVDGGGVVTEPKEAQRAKAPLEAEDGNPRGRQAA